MNRFLFTAPFVLLYGIIFAQVDTTDSYGRIETMLEETTQEQEDSQIYDSFEYLLNNPISINTASINNLLQIPFLNSATAASIILYRNKLGGLSSFEQLQNIEGLSDEVIAKIIPFLKIENPETSGSEKSFTKILNNTKFTYRFRTLQDMQTRNGFTNGHFGGTKPKFYNRLIVNYENKFDAAFLTEKDAGEKSFNDFTSYHIRIKELSFLQNAIVGDYIFEFGQGLALWSPYSFSKGSDAVGSVVRNARGAVAFVSSDENRFLRGGCAKLSVENFSLTPFYSTHKIDASIDTSTNEITSLIIDGMHRTNNEIKKQKVLEEKMLGLTAEYSFNETDKLSLLYYRSKYDHGFEKSNLLEQSGSQFEYFSAAYNWKYNNLFFSGEFAGYNYALSSINSIEFLVDKNFNMIFSYRNFSKDYFVIHGSSFGEKGTAQNESGFYAGFYWKTIIGSFNFYYDQYRFPYASNSLYFPSKGNDILIYYTFKPAIKIECRLRYKNEAKEIAAVVLGENGLAKRRNEHLRTEVLYKVSRNLQLKTRIEIAYLGEAPGMPHEKGYLIFQDINYGFLKHIDMRGRIIFFQTDSYDSRVYEFENDLIGIMTNPALFGEGTRWYLLIRYKTQFGLNISMKYSELYKPNELTISSGDNEIKGNIDNRLALQLDWNF